MTDSRKRQILAAIPLVATLCMIAGTVDVIAYILFGKIFIANMTGNTVEAGKRAEGHRRTAVFITTWIAYAVGALLGAYGALHLREQALWIPAGLVVLAATLVMRSPVKQT